MSNNYQRDAVYVENMGHFWKLTKDQWREVCQAGASGAGYDLDAYGPPLKTRPWWVRKSDSRGFWGIHRYHRLRSPLDWEPDEFKEALNELA